MLLLRELRVEAGERGLGGGAVEAELKDVWDKGDMSCVWPMDETLSLALCEGVWDCVTTEPCRSLCLGRPEPGDLSRGADSSKVLVRERLLPTYPSLLRVSLLMASVDSERPRRVVDAVDVVDVVDVVVVVVVVLLISVRGLSPAPALTFSFCLCWLCGDKVGEYCAGSCGSEACNGAGLAAGSSVRALALPLMLTLALETEFWSGVTVRMVLLLLLLLFPLLSLG